MSSAADFPRLASLEFLPYIDANGELPEHLQNQVGIYSIFDREQALQFVGYSRVYLSESQTTPRPPAGTVLLAQNCHARSTESHLVRRGALGLDRGKY